jgi:hypothetical protein
VQQLAEEIAKDEIAHVDFFRAALGTAAVPCPKIDIGPAFAAAANAAVGETLSPAFDPYANDVFFLHAAFVFEDVGVTAFRGAVEPLIPLVEPATLSAAAAVLAVEAYHAGATRTLLRELSLESNTSSAMQTPYGAIVDVVQAISDLRDSVDGAEDLDQGIVDTDNFTNIVPTDANGLVFSRSVDQVLPIVYLGPKPGGFLPEGVNGFFAGAAGLDGLGPAAAPEAASAPSDSEFGGERAAIPDVQLSRAAVSTAGSFLTIATAIATAIAGMFMAL